MTRLYPAISMGKAAEVVGFVESGATASKREAAAKKMRAYLHAKEKAAGCKFIVRRGGQHRRRYYVTLPQLRHHCPEFFNKRDEGVEILREGIGMLQDKIAGLTRGLQLLNRRLESLEARRALRPVTDDYGQSSA